jgi:pimeloyl-ACP methyl ester carboxylesterase
MIFAMTTTYDKMESNMMPLTGYTAALTTAPLPSLFMATDNGRIAYDDTGGSGPVLLAIPGMGDLRSEYRFLRPALQQAGYRVVTMDVRGFGETSAQWNDYSAHAVGRDAVALLEHLNVAHAVVLGNSFAAGSALWAAHDAPARVRAAVLLGPILRDIPQSRGTTWMLKLAFAGPWRVWFWTMYWNSLFPTAKPVDQEAAKAALSRNLREPGRMDALRIMVSLSKADTAALLPHSTTPTLIVMGTQDPDFADATIEANGLATQLSAKCLIVEGAGHYPQTEMPERVAPAILEFLGHLPQA